MSGKENRSWPFILKHFKYSATSVKNDKDEFGKVTCHSCGYSVKVRERVLGEHLRTYIWSGGTYPAGHAQAGQDWCFRYGEKEWLNPEFTVPDPQASTAPQLPARFNDYRNRADNDDSQKSNCK